MPTIMRFDGLRVVVYFNDHPPSHVHVIGGGGEAVFNLNRPNGPVVYHESQGFTASRLRGIQGALSASLRAVCLAWENIHGDH